MMVGGQAIAVVVGGMRHGGECECLLAVPAYALDNDVNLSAMRVL